VTLCNLSCIEIRKVFGRVKKDIVRMEIYQLVKVSCFWLLDSFCAIEIEQLLLIFVPKCSLSL